MPRRPKRAKDVIAELEADPQYIRQRARRDVQLADREAKLAEDEWELVAEIRSVGYSVDSVYDLVNSAPHRVLSRRFVGVYPDAYKTLAAHLSKPHHPIIREGIIRALTVADGGMLVEEALLNAFLSETDAYLRWVLANALMIAMPPHRRRKYPEIVEVHESGHSFNN